MTFLKLDKAKKQKRKILVESHNHHLIDAVDSGNMDMCLLILTAVFLRWLQMVRGPEGEKL